MAEQIGGFDVEHLYGPEQVSYRENEVVVLCLVRDGAPWVRSFVEHYFSLGAKHLVFLDNGSMDETVSILSGYERVTVLRAQLDFNADLEDSTGRTLMRRYLIERFGKDRWSLCVDIDELFDYPYSDVIGLDSLLGYLNSKSYTAVVAHMLDTFPERPLSLRMQELGEPLSAEALREIYRFYDISNLERVSLGGNRLALKSNIVESSDVAVEFRGGIHDDVFGVKLRLTKYPLLFSNGESEHVNAHNVRNARVADLTCVLFHYKFYAFEFQEHRQKAVGYKKDRSPQQHEAYERYAEVLKKDSELLLRLETAREISSVNELLDNRFLIASEDYASWVDAEERRNVLQAYPRAEPHAFAEAFLQSRKRERQKTLRMGTIEKQLLECRGQERTKSQRIRKLKQQLNNQGREIQELEEQLLDRSQKLQRSKRKRQRLTKQNDRLERQLEDVTDSRVWKLVQALSHIKVRLNSLRRS